MKKAIEEGRLLIIAPFNRSVSRITAETAQIRNKLVVDLADEVVVAHASSGGKIESLLKGIRGKPVIFL